MVEERNVGNVKDGIKNTSFSNNSSKSISPCSAKPPQVPSKPLHLTRRKSHHQILSLEDEQEEPQVCPPLPPKKVLSMSNDNVDESLCTKVARLELETIKSKPPIPARPATQQHLLSSQSIENGTSYSVGQLVSVNAYHHEPILDHSVNSTLFIGGTIRDVQMATSDQIVVHATSAIQLVNIESGMIEAIYATGPISDASSHRAKYNGTGLHLTKAMNNAYDLKVTCISCLSGPTSHNPSRSVRIAGGTEDGHVLLFDMVNLTGSQMLAKQLYAHSRSPVIGIVALPDGKCISLSTNGLVILWSDRLEKLDELLIEISDCKGVKLIFTTNQPQVNGQCAEQSNGCNSIIAAYSSKSMVIFQIQLKKLVEVTVQRIPTTIAPLLSLSSVQDEKTKGRIFSVHEDGKLVCWIVDDNYFPSIEIIFSLGPYKPTCLCVAENRYLVIGYGSTGRFTMLDSDNMGPVWNVSVEWKWKANRIEYSDRNGIGVGSIGTNTNIKSIGCISNFKQRVCTSDQLTDMNNEKSVYPNIIISLFENGTVELWDASFSSYQMYKNIWTDIPTKFTTEPIKIRVCSWNVDSQKPPIHSIKDMTTDDENVRAKFWNDWLGLTEKPDILIIGLQEVINLESKSKSAKAFLTDDLDNRGGKEARAWIDQICQFLKEQNELSKSNYELLTNIAMVGLLLIIIINNRKEPNEYGLFEKFKIRHVHKDMVKTGLGGIHGNKGTVACRLIIGDTSLCILNCHLPAGVDQVHQRNVDALAILRTTKFPSISGASKQYRFVNGGEGDKVLDHEYCIMFGDLNYRIDGKGRDEIISLLASNGHKGIEHLQKLDQLLGEQSVMLNGDYLVHSEMNDCKQDSVFIEAPIRFNPTYKYERGGDSFDRSEKQRAPAWCDRILVRCGRIRTSRDKDDKENIKILEYTSIPYIKISDHRPIAATLKVDFKKTEANRVVLGRMM